MRSRLALLRRQIDNRLVNRWPLAVFFSFSTLVPIFAPLLLVGVLTSLATPVQRPMEAAWGMVPGDRQDSYAAALVDIHDECRALAPKNGVCFEDSESKSVNAVAALEALIADAGIEGCVKTGIEAKNAWFSDYFTCLGDPEPSAFLVFTWLALGLYMLGAFFVPVGRAMLSRDILPRFNKRWMTPAAAAVPFMAMLPLTASVATFIWVAFADRKVTVEQVGEAFLLTCCCSFLIGSAIVADLRTHAFHRNYIRGLMVVVLIVSLAALLVLASASIVVGNGNPVAMLALDSIFVGGIVVTSMSLRSAPFPALTLRNAGLFTARWFALAAPFLAASVLTVLYAFFRFTWMPNQSLLLCASVLLFAILASQLVEKLLHHGD